MKNIFSVMILALIALQFAGCATITYHEHFNGQAGQRREFIDPEKNYVLAKGTLADSLVKTGGKEYYALSFPGVLKGESRCLNILIPQEYGLKPLISETLPPAGPGAPAYLFFIRSCCVEEYGEVLDPLKSRDVENNTELMKKVIAEKFPDSAAHPDRPVIFCELTFSNVHKYSLICKIWNPDAPGKKTETVFLLDEPYPSIKVRRKERNLAMTALIGAGYIFPVAFDIITSPVQAVAVIIYFAAGGAAR